MQIYINKSATQNPVWKLAALKKVTSFEYVSENRLFSGSDGYSLTITFPLKDCPQNQAVCVRFRDLSRAFENCRELSKVLESFRELSREVDDFRRRSRGAEIC